MKSNNIKKEYFIVLLLLLTGSNVSAGLKAENVFGYIDNATIGGEVHLFYRYDKNPYFGAPVGDHASNDSSFGEFKAKIRLTAEKKTDWAHITARLTPIYMGTISQDVYGSDEDEDDYNIDEAYIKLGGLFQKQVDLTVGMQDIRIEKMFVMCSGRSSRSSNWLLINQSFPFAVRLDMASGRLNANLFYARSKDYWHQWDEGNKDDVSVAGLNLHFDISETAYMYGGYYRKIDESNWNLAAYSPDGRTYRAESNTNAWDLGFEVTVNNLLMEGEGVYQHGDAGELGGENVAREAYAFWVSATYTLPVKLSPFVRFSYMFFSGDKDLNDDDRDDYDPMFIGFGGWNRFVIGELTGECHLPNSNKRVAIAEVGFFPLRNLTVTLTYLQFKLEEKHWLNVPTAHHNWADEINISVDYFPNDNWYVYFGLGHTEPNAAAKEVFGDSREAYFGQVWVAYSF